MTRYLNIDLDTTLGGVSPSDDIVSSQKAIKTYVDDRVIQYSTMPTASATLLNKIVQYTGTTNSTYTNGYFYKCVSDDDLTPTYSWTQVSVQSGSSGSIAESIENQNSAAGATDPIYDWVGTLSEWENQNISTIHPEWLCFITDDEGSNTPPAPANIHRNIGDIFYTMRTDSSLNGAVICDGSTYHTDDFTGTDSIGNLLAAGKLPYVSLSDYATALSTNGSVGVFGWDGTGTTAFRVPSLTDIFIESGTAAQIGDYLAPGLPNITGILDPGDRRFNTGNVSGCFYGTTAAANKYTSQVTTTTNQIVGFDASRSNSIYGNSTIDQPNAIRYRVMVQLATSTTDTALETCTSVLADVAELKYDYVVDFQAPTSSNNYTWYRKYKSGWVEQGGITTSGTVVQSVALPVTMADTNYTISLVTTSNNSSGFNNVSIVGYENVSTTGFDTRGNTVNSQSQSSTATGTRRWRIAGMAASS